MTSLMKLKLESIARRYNIKDEDLTPDNMLEIAISAEEKCVQLGPFDPAFVHFKQVQRDFEAAMGYFTSPDLQAA